MDIHRIFLASSAELKEDRLMFELLVARTNKNWVRKGIFIDLVIWEDFLDALSPTRLQDEYNTEIRQCDIFVMLFFTKVGPYTEEEFETAIGQFQATKKPFIFTYFKDAPITTGGAIERDFTSLWAFQKKLKALGHFFTSYRNVEGLQLHFLQQLEKLAARGFAALETEELRTPAGSTGNHTVSGSGAVASNHSTALGSGAVMIVHDAGAEDNKTVPGEK